ncbi:3-hydroxyacyl-ACP dehydratase [Streptomyces sp. NPDC000405]|uniref:3-hydroxyacyl-ACP dehydratase n=1 Tax=Streptomyces sp. NPDC000405 TaxID=3161033 RepID=UPI00398D3EA4
MDELDFDGIPLGPLHGPRPDPDPAAPVPDGTATPTGIARMLAREAQRAHAAALDAHRALSAWQAGLVAAGTVLAPAPRPGGVPDVWERWGGPASALRAAARALAEAMAPRPCPGVFTATWHDPVPYAPAPLRAHSAPDGACEALDGERAILTLRATDDATDEGPPRRQVPRFPEEFHPHAVTDVHRLTRAELDALAAGDVAGVFGPAHDQRGLEPDELPAPWPARLLEEITVGPRAGRYGQGLLTATARPADDGNVGPRWPYPVAAALEALRVYAFHQGLHLCLPGARVLPLPGRPVRVEWRGGPAGPETPGEPWRLTVEVVELGLLPRPYAVADCEITSGGRVVARLHDLGATVRERPGPGLAPHPDRGCCRKTSSGARARYHELHIAHTAEGDPAELGTLGAAVTAPVRPRLPRAGLRMVDRVVDLHRSDGPKRAGARLVTEHDVPADPWYAREHGGGLPVFALMEMALQPLGLLGGLSGAAHAHPDRPLVCRNLEGRARLTRACDPRASTVVQESVLLSTAVMPGAVVDRYAFSLSTGGEVFCTGEAAHGYLTPEVLALRQGLDGGRETLPWLERRPVAPAGARRLDVRHDARLGRGRLALLEDVVLVPGGGEHGAGYVLCDKAVDPGDWFFGRHFPHDPVLPGSVGVQMLFQAVRAFALYTGLADQASPGPGPEAVPGEELRWTYRGQILREHRRVRGEVHIREVRAAGGTVLVRADGSVWRDGLRIHRADNIAVALPDARRGTP